MWLSYCINSFLTPRSVPTRLPLGLIHFIFFILMYWHKCYAAIILIVQANLFIAFSLWEESMIFFSFFGWCELKNKIFNKIVKFITNYWWLIPVISATETSQVTVPADIQTSLQLTIWNLHFTLVQHLWRKCLWIFYTTRTIFVITTKSLRALIKG